MEEKEKNEVNKKLLHLSVPLGNDDSPKLLHVYKPNAPFIGIFSLCLLFFLL